MVTPVANRTQFILNEHFPRELTITSSATSTTSILRQTLNATAIIPQQQPVSNSTAQSEGSSMKDTLVFWGVLVVLLVALICIGFVYIS